MRADGVKNYVSHTEALSVKLGMVLNNSCASDLIYSSAERSDSQSHLSRCLILKGRSLIPKIAGPAVNTQIQEYRLRHGSECVFPPLDLARYHAQLRQQLLHFEDSTARAHFLAMIPGAREEDSAERMPLAARVRRSARKLLWPFLGEAFNRLWRACAAAGWTPPGMRWLTFPDSESALRTAYRYMIRPVRRSFFLADFKAADVETLRRE